MNALPSNYYFISCLYKIFIIVNNYLLKELMNLPMPHCFIYKTGASSAYHIGALNL